MLYTTHAAGAALYKKHAAAQNSCIRRIHEKDQPFDILYKEYQTAHPFPPSPSHYISFMPAVATTSGHLHCELVRILVLRETDHFFAASGVEQAQHN
jgi:hypothetical protein